MADPSASASAQNAPSSEESEDGGSECAAAGEEGPAPQRDVEVCARDVRGLGTALAAAYGELMHNGLQRAREYYTQTPPISCSNAKWQELARNARLGTQMCCPNAAAFFEGLEAGLGWDVYEALVDFEVYTLELQRRADERRRAGKSSSSSSSSSSKASSESSNSSDSEMDGGTLASLGTAAVQMDEEQAEATAEAARIATAGAESKAGATAEVDKLANARVESKAAQPLSNGRCTGFAFGGVDGRVAIVAQTADLPPLLYGYGDFDRVICLKTPHAGALVYDSDGRLCPIGMNSAGMGLSVFNLHLSQTTGFDQPALTVQTVLWELLLAQHTLSSGTDWLRNIKGPLMCGSALLLADATGSKTVELISGSPPAISELRCGTPTIRANHPLQDSSRASFGGSEHARRESERRQATLGRRLSAWSAKAPEQGKGAPPAAPSRGEDALAVLRSSKKVRNLSTLACVACDLLQRRLHVEFRERQSATELEVTKIAQELALPPKRVARALAAGSVQCRTGRRRMTTGKPAKHFTRWARHAVSLDCEEWPCKQQAAATESAAAAAAAAAVTDIATDTPRK